MHKIFRCKYIFPLFCVSILLGCTKQSEEYTFDANCETKAYVDPNQYSRAVYHSMSESWIVPQNDPYALSNFQNALKDMLSDDYRKMFSDADYSSLLDLIPIRPTHMALRMFPRNESEQWKIEMMDDVKVSYTPFNYVQLSAEQVKCSGLQDKTRRFEEEYRYTVTYVDIESSSGKKIADDTDIMPVLYVVWPIDEAIPQEYDYIVDYEVFIPDSKNTDNKMLQLLEDEAIRIALGEKILTKAGSGATQTRTGTVNHNDTWLNRYVPLANLKIRFQLGSNIVDTYTDSDGVFSVPSEVDDKESYAAYVANYLCERYYISLGYISPSPSQTLYTGQSHQFWKQTEASPYSPLFVDLFDSYNQYIYDSNHNPDPINGFSHSIVRTIASDCKNWDQVKEVLDDYIGVYYTQSEYDSYVAPYDYWFSQN